MKDFQKQHEKIFDEYLSLVESASILEDEVKTYCKQNRASLDAQFLFAKFTASKTRGWNATVLKEKLTSEEYMLASAMGVFVTPEVVEEVDEKILKGLIKMGKIDENRAKEAYFEKENGTLTVTISEK